MKYNFDEIIDRSNNYAVKFDETKEKVYPRLLQMSSDSHLFASGVDTKYWNVLDI